MLFRSIGLWYDVGRYLIGSTIDSDESTAPLWMRATLFIGWISFILSVIIFVHIKFEAIPLLFMIPILGLPLQRWLFSFDWDNLEYPLVSRDEFIILLVWFITSPMVYWILKFAWIVFRVKTLEAISDGTIFYIQ